MTVIYFLCVIFKLFFLINTTTFTVQHDTLIVTAYLRNTTKNDELDILF